MADKFKVGDEVTFIGVVYSQHPDRFVGFWGDNELTEDEMERGLVFKMIRAKVAYIHGVGDYGLTTMDGTPIGFLFREEDLMPGDHSMSFLA